MDKRASVCAHVIATVLYIELNYDTSGRGAVVLLSDFDSDSCLSKFIFR